MARPPAPLSRIQAVEDLVRQGVGIARACRREGVPVGQYYDRRPELPAKETNVAKQTPIEKIQEVQDFIDGGMAVGDACKAAGVSMATYYNRRGELQANGSGPRKAARAASVADVLAHARKRRKTLDVVEADPTQPATPAVARQNGEREPAVAGPEPESARMEQFGAAVAGIMDHMEKQPVPAGWGVVETAVSPPRGPGTSMYADVAARVIRSAGPEWARIQAPDERSVKSLRTHLSRHTKDLELRQVTTADGLYLYWRVRPAV